MIGYPGKRLLDLGLILVSLPVSVPVLLALALAVRVALGSPVLFRQRRPGLKARPFDLLKFRTMTDERDGEGRPLSDERRLTRFGRFLRATSLDELPELINVVRGEMSLVGPRPLLMEYLPLYSARHARRHEVRPGVTGLAQVEGRNALSWPEKFEHDVRYVDRCSLRMDISILLRTVRAVVRRHGITAPGDATMPKFRGYDDAAAPARADSAISPAGR